MSLNISDYGTCPRCGGKLLPVWFEEEEFTTEYGYLHHTGRVKTACSHLECAICAEKVCVDDTFDGAWMHKKIKVYR